MPFTHDPFCLLRTIDAATTSAYGANGYAWHVGCGAAFGAKHSRGSSVMFGKNCAAMKFFRADLNFEFTDRWYLGRPVGKKGTVGEQFISGRRVGTDEVFRIPVRKRGPELPLTIGNFGTIVVECRAAQSIALLCGDAVELVGAEIEEATYEYKILNVVSVLDCVDSEKSEISYASCGKVLAVPKLRINRSKITSEHIFLTAECGYLVMSDAMRSMIRSLGPCMLTFKSV